MIRMHAILLTLLFAVTPTDIQAASADRAQYPANEHGYLFYLSTSHLQGEERAKCEATLAFVVASSSRQEIAEKCVPVQVAEGLFRIDLRDVQWDWRLWHKVVAKYPYGLHRGLQLVYRADWLIIQLADTTESNAHYLLLYGSDKFNRNDFLKFWGANNDVRSHFGLVARSTDPSGPAVTGIRFIENRPTNLRGSAWGTRDSAKINYESDPLEHLDNKFRHDAEEWLVANPKQSLTTGERGSLLAAWINNAQGKRQEEAPPNIVTDHHGFRGQAAIRNWGSCVSCHASGINEPGINELRAYIASGADVYATPKSLQEQIERFHLSDAAKQIQRDNEDFAAGLRMVNGLDGQTNAEAFTATIDRYDAELSLGRAAAELHTTPEELRLALAYASQSGRKIGARLSALPHGGTVSRASWESFGWWTAYCAMKDWEGKR